MQWNQSIVVGDIHGCLDELKELLAQVSFDPTTDRLVSVGDLVGKGPQSIEVIHFFRSLPHAFAVRGNHDQFCLDQRRDLKTNGKIERAVDPTHMKVIEQLDEDSWTWLENLPLFIDLPEFNALIVHAGKLPHISLAEHVPFDLMNMRNIHEGKALPHAKEGVPWVTLHEGPTHIIFGHDAVRGLQQYEHATGLDTGCCYGGKLSAVILPKWEIVQVDAKAIHSKPNIPLQPRSGPKIEE
eukprot:TRINITY_DN7911_c0_g1_i1.p1 TRINITY_DN7911_c0_g1~~TRINITY_DN7911_c0_g1_i1.p1  ORF type:complete len:240 (-),score=58.32 TRINITY_DN7911_c0_g1_i1:76-795(-)